LGEPRQGGRLLGGLRGSSGFSEKREKGRVKNIGNGKVENDLSICEEYGETEKGKAKRR